MPRTRRGRGLRPLGRREVIWPGPLGHKAPFLGSWHWGWGRLATLPSACDMSETHDLGHGQPWAPPQGPGPFMESRTGTSEASGSGSGLSLCRGGYSGSQRCPPCLEPPAAQGISRPSGLPGGRSWDSLATPFMSLRLPSWGGTGFVVGRLFSSPSSRPSGCRDLSTHPTALSLHGHLLGSSRVEVGLFL